jgi:hypothetical protein
MPKMGVSTTNANSKPNTMPPDEVSEVISAVPAHAAKAIKITTLPIINPNPTIFPPPAIVGSLCRVFVY